MKIAMPNFAPMSASHHYALELSWIGNLGLGTSTYEGYSREHVVRIAGKPDLRGTADPLFRGDAALHNPEDLLLAALSQCHLLTYLALCARARINVVSYRDAAEGTLLLTKDGGGQFTEEDEQLATALAGTAGVAIENARLYEESERRRRWLASSTEVTRTLLSSDAERPLELIARRAAENADAVLAMLLLPIGGERLSVDVATGPLGEQLVGKVVPADD